MDVFGRNFCALTLSAFHKRRMNLPEIWRRMNRRISDGSSLGCLVSLRIETPAVEAGHFASNSKSSLAHNTTHPLAVTVSFAQGDSALVSIHVGVHGVGSPVEGERRALSFRGCSTRRAPGWVHHNHAVLPSAVGVSLQRSHDRRRIEVRSQTKFPRRVRYGCGGRGELYHLACL